MPEADKKSSKYLSAAHLKQNEIVEFLQRLYLEKYAGKFLSNGYDDVNFLVGFIGIQSRFGCILIVSIRQNGVVTLQDLLQMGIENYDDAFKILKEIKTLPQFIKRMGELNDIMTL